MEDKANLSLDAIIKANKKGGRRGGKARGGGGRGSSVSSSRGRGGAGPMKRGRGNRSRSAPYSRPRSMPDKWEHDMYGTTGNSRGQGRGRGRGRGSSSGGRGGGISSAGGAHIQISNLDFGVTEQDVKELFQEFGRLKKWAINYDSTGRSHGTADVFFMRTEDALRAQKTYNGVPLDGRSMKIELGVGVREAVQATKPASARQGQGNRGRGGRQQAAGRLSARGASGGRRGGRGAGRGRGRGRGGARDPVPSKDELDTDLDGYLKMKD